LSPNRVSASLIRILLSTGTELCGRQNALRAIPLPRTSRGPYRRALRVTAYPPGGIRGPFNRLFRTSDAGRRWQMVKLPFDAEGYQPTPSARRSRSPSGPSTAAARLD
jgi:hypothetical protein